MRLVSPIKLIQAAALIMSARDHTAHHRYESADRDFRRAHQKLGLEYISRDATIDLNLLASQIFIGLQRGPDALEAAQIAKTQIAQSKGHLRDADRTYLDCYCDALIDYCVHWRDQTDPPTDRSRHVDREKVSKHLLNKFPLPREGFFI